MFIWQKFKTTINQIRVWIQYRRRIRELRKRDPFIYD
jgi:uncharacterized protein YjiS (DUF1127 family)